MEPEYKIVKCPTCGHERQGPRIIRLASHHAKEWAIIQKNWNRFESSWMAILLGGLVFSFFASALFAAYKFHWLIAMAPSLLWLCVFIYFVFCIDEKNIDERIVQEQKILKQYGIQENESCVVET